MPSAPRSDLVPSVITATATAQDPDEASTNTVDPFVPRAIDRPTVLPDRGRIDPATGDIAKIFAAPENPADWPSWRARLQDWRDQARERLGYRGTIYEREQSSWTQRCYSIALAWLWDERLFDHEHQQFTVDAFLETTADLGGFDAVVLWHAYPIIGIDDRNQFDFYRQVPGLTEVIAQFRAHGIRVFIDYNPWDTGTRRAEHGDPEELAALVGELGVDGVFLDTMKEGDSALVDALLHATPPQVLEGESRVPNQRIEDHQLSWAQWFADSAAPGVMRAHWYERRHMMHSTRRWNRDHSAELQSAWMNGTGILVWDAVFGTWVGWNERDKSTLRRMLRVQRALSDVLVDGRWTPLTDGRADAITAGVYVSRFDRADLSLWTIVNRADRDFTGAVLDLTPPADPGALRHYDLGSGAALAFIDAPLTVPARSIAAVLEVRGDQPTWLGALLEDAAADPFTGDATFPARTAVRRSAPISFARTAPETAVLIEPGHRVLDHSYRRRETGGYHGAPYIEEWKPLPPRLHDDRRERIEVTLDRVAVAQTEVTNAQFAAFLENTGYRPRSPGRFLAHWNGAEPSAAAAAQPVAMVNLDDARAYALWTGARLPTEFEWQVAAADPRFRRGEPSVWNWTESEHNDGITRFAMLKGGSAHRSAGSDWYVDGGLRTRDFSLKLLLAGLGVERSSSIGFRLAWDLEKTS